MTETLLRGRLVNAEGELIAEGKCWLDEVAGMATLEPERPMSVVQKQRGALSLELDNGRSLAVSDRPMVVRIAPPGSTTESNDRRNLFRLRLLKSSSTELTTGAQDADAAGAGEGTPSLRLDGEAPAAR